ncbi:MAG: hypothetical protein R3D00_18580 [Bacteroidia bacterium]
MTDLPKGHKSPFRLTGADRSGQVKIFTIFLEYGGRINSPGVASSGIS